MARLGTLLDTVGRPEDRVEIIRKSKKTTRIRRSTNNGRSWSPTDQLVATELILDDGGARFDQHTQNPGHATYLGLAGVPQARLKIQRVYAVITKAQVYLGDNTWSDVQDFPTRDICFDGGASIGWTTPTWHHPADTTDEKNSEPAEDVGEKQQREGEPAVAPATTPTTQLAVPTPAALVPTPKGQRFAYLRVSSTDQNLARQRAMIGDVDKEFIDELSARSRANRPGLDNCIDYLRDHDELYVASIDRLARSLVDLRGIIDQITAKGASVHFLKENLTFSKETTDPRDTLMLSILGSFAEFERSIIRERQAEGIALAKKAGKYKGRKRAISPEDLEKARRRVAAGESKIAIAKDLGVGRATLYRALSEMN